MLNFTSIMASPLVVNTTGCVQISNTATSSHQTSNVIKCSCVSILSCDDASYDIVSLCAAPEGQCITTRDAIYNYCEYHQKSIYYSREGLQTIKDSYILYLYVCSHIYTIRGKPAQLQQIAIPTVSLQYTTLYHTKFGDNQPLP